MEFETIKHDPKQSKKANCTSYKRLKKSFKWDNLSNYCEQLDFKEEVNIAHIAIDRFAQFSLQGHIALKFIKKDGSIDNYTYENLKVLTNKFANVLKKLKVKERDNVFCLSPRTIQLYISCFGILKNKAVFCPLFSAFGPSPILERMAIANAKILITTESIFQKKVLPIVDELDFIEHIILVPDNNKKTKANKVMWFDELMDEASDEFIVSKTLGHDPSIIHFTSGTTGKPKAALHTHRAVYGHAFSARIALDMQEKDIYWCSADPGWVTGTSYGIIAPLVNQVTSIVVETEFNALQWIQILQEHKVSIWYTAPTAIRMLMCAKISPKLPIKLPKLRLISSVGEALNPEAIRWSLKTFKLPIHDNWWQTETGSIMISNYLCMDIKLGSMGKPIPGVEIEIVELDKNSKVKIIETPYKTGIIAIKKGWPSMFQDYLNDHKKYLEAFHSNYYLSGDLAYKDQDGYFWFVGRMDDLIKTAGHLVGPFEIESILMEHQIVAEAAVIGKQDSICGQLIKAFVVLTQNTKETQQAKEEILAYCRKKLGTSIAPKEIEFVSDLPKTRSGKIMRRLLRAKELGIDSGDTSTLINPDSFL